MKAIEFSSVIGTDRVLTIPSSLASNIPAGKTVRVLILLADGDSNADWESATAQAFGLGYADSDAIYDQLSAG